MNATPHVVAEKVALGAVRIISTLYARRKQQIRDAKISLESLDNMSDMIYN